MSNNNLDNEGRSNGDVQNSESTDGSDPKSVEESAVDQRPSPTIPEDINLETGSKIATQCLCEEIGASISKSTAKSYACNLRGYINYIDGGVLEVDSQYPRSYIKHRARDNRRENTIIGDISAIKKLYEWIRFETNLDAEVDLAALNYISASDFQTPNEIEREPIEEEELEQLYEEFTCFRDRLIATFAGTLGPRNVDVTKVKVDDIDFEANEIELNNTKGNRTYLQPISDELAVDLIHYINERRDIHINESENEYLFPSSDGGKLTTESFCKIVKEAAERAGIQGILGTYPAERGTDGPSRKMHRVTPHALRHTFNDIMDKANIPVEARSKALDQDSIEVNKKYYTVDSEEYKRHIRDKLYDGGS